MQIDLNKSLSSYQAEMRSNQTRDYIEMQTPRGGIEIVTPRGQREAFEMQTPRQLAQHFQTAKIEEVLQEVTDNSSESNLDIDLVDTKIPDLSKNQPLRKSKGITLPKKKQDVIDQENLDLVKELNSVDTKIEFETPKDMKAEKAVNPTGKVLQLNLSEKVVDLTHAISLIK